MITKNQNLFFSRPKAGLRLYARVKEVTEEILIRNLIFVHTVVHHFHGTGKKLIKSLSMSLLTSSSTSHLTHHRNYVVCAFDLPRSACSTCEKGKELDLRDR